jgi:hypothetical protein
MALDRKHPKSPERQCGLRGVGLPVRIANTTVKEIGECCRIRIVWFVWISTDDIAEVANIQSHH